MWGLPLTQPCQASPVTKFTITGHSQFTVIFTVLKALETVIGMKERFLLMPITR